MCATHRANHSCPSRHHTSIFIDDSHGWIHLTNQFDRCIVCPSGCDWAVYKLEVRLQPPFHIPAFLRPCWCLTFKKVSGETKQGEEQGEAQEMCVPPGEMDRLVDMGSSGTWKQMGIRMEMEAHQQLLPAGWRKVVWCAPLRWKCVDSLAWWVGNSFFLRETCKAFMAMEIYLNSVVLLSLAARCI